MKELICQNCVLTKQTVSALICISGDWLPAESPFSFNHNCGRLQQPRKEEPPFKNREIPAGVGHNRPYGDVADSSRTLAHLTRSRHVWPVVGHLLRGTGPRPPRTEMRVGRAQVNRLH